MSNFNQNGSGLFVGEQLMAQAKRIYDEQLPPLNADLLLPPTGAEDRGAAQFAREVYQSQGEANWVADAADDLPRVNVSVIRDVYNIDMAGCAYAYTLKEVNAAQFANKPLEARRGLAGRRAIESFRNSLFFIGSLAKQIYGLFSFPFIPRIQLSLADFQPGAAPDDTLQALYSLEELIDVATKQSAHPTHLLLPPVVYNYISKTRVSTLNNDTILTVYKANSQWAKEVVSVRELNTAGPTGGPVMAAIRVAPDAAEHIVTNPLEIRAPQERNLVTVVNMITEVGGFVTEFPLNHAIGELS